jgi:glutamate/tyrosine decarboxylase-like PLP-dependent enzyme
MIAGLVLTRHPEIEVAAFNLAASYIPGDDIVDPFRRGVPSSRRSEGLTVWMTLRAHGWKTIREAVERNVHLTRRLEDGLRTAGFRVLEDGQLSIACARWEPLGTEKAALDQLQSQIAKSVVATGRAWFSTTLHEGEVWLRFNLVNIHTREHNIDDLAELLTQTARATTPLGQ